MAISRAQLVKELEPGLNALFGLEYKRYDNQHAEIYVTESSDRAFEEEVMLSGFANADVKAEGQGIAYDDAQETFTARYTNETIALAFAITEEAIEDNLYDRIASRYTKALARSMANTKQVKGAAVLNNAFSTSYVGGDGKALCATGHPTLAGTFSNELATAADFNKDLYSNLSKKSKQEIKNTGSTEYTSYGFSYILTNKFFIEAKKNNILNKPFKFSKPLILIHGLKDDAVNFKMPQKIMKIILGKNVQFPFKAEPY